MPLDLKDKVFLLAPKDKGLVVISNLYSTDFLGPLDLSIYDKFATSFDIAFEWLFNARVIDSKYTYREKRTDSGAVEVKYESHGPNCVQEYYTDSGYDSVAVDFPYINEVITSNGSDSELIFTIIQYPFVDREESVTALMPTFLIEDDSVYYLEFKRDPLPPSGGGYTFEASLSKTEYKTERSLIPNSMIEYRIETNLSKITDTYFTP